MNNNNYAVCPLSTCNCEVIKVKDTTQTGQKLLQGGAQKVVDIHEEFYCCESEGQIFHVEKSTPDQFDLSISLTILQHKND